MSAPKNIQRDAIFVEPDPTAYAWSTAVTIGLDPKINGPASQQVDFCSVTADVSTNYTHNSGSVRGIGCYFQSIDVERTPFRIRASVQDEGTYRDRFGGCIVIGYIEASPSGTDDVISGATYIPFQNELDELVIVEPEVSGETYYQRGVAFGLLLNPYASITSSKQFAYLSVQNLGIKPPTMQNAVS